MVDKESQNVFDEDDGGMQRPLSKTNSDAADGFSNTLFDIQTNNQEWANKTSPIFTINSGHTTVQRASPDNSVYNDDKRMFAHAGSLSRFPNNKIVEDPYQQYMDGTKNMK